MTAALESTRFRLGLCFRRLVGADVSPEVTGPTVVVTELTVVVVMVGPVVCVVEPPLEVKPPDVDPPVAELLPLDEPDCEPLPRLPAALLEGAVMLAKSAGESLLSVARYACAPF